MSFCPSCGAKIEGVGNSCDSCGANTGLKPAAPALQTPAKKNSDGCLIALAVLSGLIVLVIVIVSLGDHSGSSSPSSSSPSSYGIKTDVESQKGREEWIENAKAMGMFLKLEDDPPVAYDHHQMATA